MYMGKANRKINHGIVICFVFILIPFLSLSGIKNILDNNIYQAGQIFSILLLIVFVIIKCKQIRLGWATCIFSIYQIAILLSSIINNGISPGIIVVTIASIIIFALLQTNLYCEILSSICVIIIISLLINFLIMLKNWNDPNVEFFIGGKNSLGIFLIPGIFLLIINAIEKYDKINTITLLLVILCMLTVCIGVSGTGIVVTICTIVLLIIVLKFKPQKTIYLGAIFLIYALFLLFSEKFFLSEYWIRFTNLLGKDSTLTSRTSIWIVVKEQIHNKLLFGSGRGVELYYINTLGVQQTIYESHNFILEILLEGGIMALLIFGVLLFKAVKQLDMNNLKHKIIFIALCVLMINGLTESTINNFLVLIILGIACRYASEQKSRFING